METKPPPLSTGDKIILTFIFALPVLGIALMNLGVYLVIHYNVKIIP